MVGDEGPGIADGGGFGEDGAEAGKELLIVLGVFEDGALLYASDDDVMEGAGSIDACLAGPGESMAREVENVTMSSASPLLGPRSSRPCRKSKGQLPVASDQ